MATGDTTNTKKVVTILEGATVIDGSAGTHHSVALVSQGGLNTLYAWGTIFSGDATNFLRLTPREVEHENSFSKSTKLIRVTSGWFSVYVVDEHYNLYSWGSNGMLKLHCIKQKKEHSQLGDGTIDPRTYPKLVSRSNLMGHMIRDLQCYDLCLAISTSDDLIAWTNSQPVCLHFSTITFCSLETHPVCLH